MDFFEKEELVSATPQSPESHCLRAPDLVVLLARAIVCDCRLHEFGQYAMALFGSFP